MTSFINVLLISQFIFALSVNAFQIIQDEVVNKELPPKALGIGSTCVDLFVQVDDLFLSKYGLEKKGLSTSIDISEFQQILDTSRSDPIIIPGGSVANTIRGLAKLGEKCAFLSCRGEDSFGDFFAENLKNLHILDWTVLLPEYPTSRALCLITPDGQRTIFWADKKNNDLPLNPDYFKNTTLIHVGAHSLRNGDYLEQIMKLASKENILISMSLSSIEVVLQYKETLLDLLEHYVDVVFANEEEIKALFHLPVAEGCFKLQQMCPIVVVTRGSNGCLVGNANELMAFPAFPAEVIDTTGAGDLFASGFLHGLLNGYPLSKCANIGNFLGSMTVTTIGAAIPEEKWQVINAYLHTMKVLSAFDYKEMGAVGLEPTETEVDGFTVGVLFATRANHMTQSQ